MASLNLTTRDVQILAAILQAQRSSFAHELNSATILTPDRARLIKEGLDVCDKVLQALHLPMDAPFTPPA